MNKSVRRIACLLLSAMTACSFVACGDDDKKTGGKLDKETRPVVFATETLDGNFNPFFATSATDSEMASMTQLGMLTTDEYGNVICGENEPTVALDFKKTETSDKKYTDYEFIIKNGIKFSDGVELTIKDVLFNLYVYLDPSYMGSATMYSTDIVGLMDYRAQEKNTNLTDATLNTRFNGEANTRLTNLVNHLDDPDKYAATQQITDDIAKTKELFLEEVTSDWNMNKGSLESYKDEYAFTEDWQVYYLAEGIVRVYTVQGKPVRDENGKYVTNITPAGVKLEDGTTYNGSYLNPAYAKEIEDVQKDEAALKAYTDTGATLEDAKEFVVRDWAIKTVYSAHTANDDKLIEIVTYWATGTNLFNYFVGEARTAYFSSKGDGKLVVDTISGITTTTTTKDFNGKEIGKHDVLKIRINGIDPKAEYNFAFAVAPMHYYSGEFNGKDYVKASKDELSKEPSTWTEFGVAFNNNKFFETILQADAKNAKPVGAGAYQVSNQKGETKNVGGDEFYANNWVYFARNDYFKTVGSGINNAKIKYLRYRVVNSDKLIQALQAKNIDVGEPNATPTNIKEIGKVSHLNQKTVATNGYGYVGINPKYVPDIEVRRAIMHALEPRLCIETYYTEEYAEVLYRSMSKESWIWTQDGIDIPDEPYYEFYTKKQIQTLVESAGWKKGSDGIYAKGGDKLKFTFTLAGATTDHPAYQMFIEAESFLEDCGFDITVTTDISALKKLATGQLEVWAAAWSSTVDPDMYQVYHKDSKATSVNNWGYPTILNDSTTQFTYEKRIINELSALIEDGRETNSKPARAAIYMEALDLVMDLAVELPTYQRKDCVAYNKEVIKASSLNQNPTAFAGVIDKIWELDYV